MEEENSVHSTSTKENHSQRCNMSLVTSNNLKILHSNPIEKKNKRTGTSCSDVASAFTSSKKIKFDDDNIRDSAETIKKIQAFIASGSSGKLHNSVLSENDSDSFVVLNDSNERTPEGEVNICKLQRTLQGLDDSQDDSTQSDLSIKNVELRPDGLSSICRSSERLRGKRDKFSFKQVLDRSESFINKDVESKDTSEESKKEILSSNRFSNERKPKKVNFSISSDSSDDDVLKDLPLQKEPSLGMQYSGQQESFKTSSNRLTSLKEKNCLLNETGRCAVANGQITLELNQNSKKKVVRIAVPPKAGPFPRASLGPDIIIKRVKSDRKMLTTQIGSKVSPSDLKCFNNERGVSPTILEEFPAASSYSHKVSSRLSAIGIERAPVKKLQDAVVKMQKKIVKRGNLEQSNLMSVKYVHLPKSSDTKQETVIISGDELLQSAMGTPMTDVSPSKTLIESRAKPKCIDTKDKSYPKKSKRSLADDSSTSVSSSSDEEEIEEYDIETLFDSYFITNERFVERHEGLDSDSSSDFDQEMFTHFLNLKQDNSYDECSVYDLIHDISIELPSWNIHGSLDGETCYLVQVERGEEKVIMKKVIELDLDNNAKVYINDLLIPQFNKKYPTYQDVRKLIYDVHQL